MKRAIALAILALLVSSLAQAVIRRVPQDYPTIQAAVDASSPGDAVLVAPGTYSDVVHQFPGDTTKCVVVMKSGVTVTGSGQGSTFIDPLGRGRGFHCEGTTNVTIQNLAVRNANARIYGAGIFCKDGANATIQNSTLTNCLDGAVISLASTMNLTSCTFTGNLSKQGGAVAIEIYQGTPSIATILSCTMNNNAAPSGGAVFVRGSAITMRYCNLTGNQVNAINGSGGGITIIESQATIRDSQVLSNHVDGIGGGMAILEGASVTLERCLLQGNYTEADEGYGGGIYCAGSSLSMQDCTMARNRVEGGFSDGGGIYALSASSMTINQCTLAANECTLEPTLGGGITIVNSSPTISKSIIAFNAPGKGMHCADGSSVPVVSCSDIFGNAGGDAICGTNAGHNFSLDPQFCNLAANNFRIAMTSPCYPGNHPDGPNACQRDRIGGQDPGCNPAGLDDSAAGDAAGRLISRPNPFFPRTTIYFELARAGSIRLAIYDPSGRWVRTLVEGSYPAGKHQEVWDGRDAEGRLLPSGVYFGRLETDGLRESRALVLAR